MKSDSSRVQWRVYVTIFCLSVLFLVYLFGVASVNWKLWPYPFIEKGVQAAKAWKEKLIPFSPYETSFYHAARHKKGGIVTHDPKKAYDGYTFFTFGLDHKAVLLTMNGKIVHQWYKPFSTVWPNPSHIKSPVSDDLINMSAPFLFPDGDILVIYATDRDTPYGYGLAKIDQESSLVWKYSARAHHDVDVGGDGRIYLLTHEMRKSKVPGLNVKPPVLDDYVVVLSSDGEELIKVSVTKAFNNSRFSGVLENAHNWEPWHANNIEVLEGEMAKQFPFLKKGCVLVSLKGVTVIAAIDPYEKKVIWGPWKGQHDPDFLMNGNLLIFDNKGHAGEGGRSRIMEFDPETLETRWEYAGDKSELFFSAIRSAQQRLPNGNTLITESDNGRIFDVTMDKEIVWDYRLPYRAPHDKGIVAVVMRSQRVKKDTLNFTFNKGDQ